MTEQTPQAALAEALDAATWGYDYELDASVAANVLAAAGFAIVNRDALARAICVSNLTHDPDPERRPNPQLHEKQADLLFAAIAAPAAEPERFADLPATRGDGTVAFEAAEPDSGQGEHRPAIGLSSAGRHTLCMGCGEPWPCRSSSPPEPPR